MSKKESECIALLSPEYPLVSCIYDVAAELGIW
jgi:hypothetical protein